MTERFQEGDSDRFYILYCAASSSVYRAEMIPEIRIDSILILSCKEPNMQSDQDFGLPNKSTYSRLEATRKRGPIAAAAAAAVIAGSNPSPVFHPCHRQTDNGRTDGLTKPRRTDGRWLELSNFAEWSVGLKRGKTSGGPSLTKSGQERNQRPTTLPSPC